MVASSEWRAASSDSPLFAIRYSPFASDRSSDVSRFDEGGSPPSSGVGGGHQYKVERALSLYQAGVGSLGYIAEQLGLSKRDLIREARMRGIEPVSGEETVQEELA